MSGYLVQVKEPLSPADAKRLILAILDEGTVAFSKHAQEEMGKDDLGDADAINVLRGGVVEPAEHEGGSWRYRVRTTRMVFVTAFRSEDSLRVVTAWRIKR